ncbi:oxygenase MpaB family protein [Actinocorallia sp. B10E7]|uniref:oxygenase MpaB family protein n=1 Tax=Actinocorallia sp. B10E7 TaxID=3153558 RepID=UPI00325E3F03
MDVTQEPPQTMPADGRRPPQTRTQRPVDPIRRHGWVQDKLDHLMYESAMLPGVRFDRPAGDPGWFSPDSAMWYVHSHFSAIAGGFVGLMCEGVKPDMVYGGLDHSDFFNDRKRRGGRSASFYWATVFGPTEVAEKICRNVHRYHETVQGTMPDGTPYAANSAENLRWAHAGLTWGYVRGHQLYHPRPLPPKKLDEVVAGMARIHEAIGATDLPRTMEEIEEYYRQMRPRMCINEDGKWALDFAFSEFDKPGRAPMRWALEDAMPWWAREVLGAKSTPRQRAIGRKLNYAVVNGVQKAIGTPWYVKEARERIKAAS